MSKIRNSRWEYRETVKRLSNKHGNLLHTHPQVRRQIEAYDNDEVRWPKPKKYKTTECKVLKKDHDFIIVKETPIKWYRDGETMMEFKCKGCGKEMVEFW